MAQATGVLFPDLSHWGGSGYKTSCT